MAAWGSSNGRPSTCGSRPKHAGDANVDHSEALEVERESVTAWVSAQRLERLRYNVEQCNRRLARNGLDGMLLQVLGTRVVPVEDTKHRLYMPIKETQVLLEGPVCSKGEYRLLATIDHTSMPIALRCLSQGEKIPARYLTEEPHCEHCGTTRNRRFTMLVASRGAGAGAIRRVGASCLLEFTGMTPEAALCATSVWDDLKAMIRGDSPALEGKDEPTTDWGMVMPLKDFLFCAAAVILRHGFVSKKAVRQAAVAGRALVASSDRAMAMWAQRSEEAQQCGHAVLEPRDGMEELAQQLALKSLEDARERLPITGSEMMTELEANLAAVAAGEAIDQGRAGLACYLVQDYLSRGMNTPGKGVESSWLAREGDAIEVHVTTVSIVELPGLHGSKKLHQMIDDHGNRLTWFSSGGALPLLERVKVQARVKSHRLQDGIRQTVLSHVAEVPKEHRAAA